MLSARRLSWAVKAGAMDSCTSRREVELQIWPLVLQQQQRTATPQVPASGDVRRQSSHTLVQVKQPLQVEPALKP